MAIVVVKDFIRRLQLDSKYTTLHYREASLEAIN